MKPHLGAKQLHVCCPAKANSSASYGVDAAASIVSMAQLCGVGVCSAVRFCIAAARTCNTGNTAKQPTLRCTVFGLL